MQQRPTRTIRSKEIHLRIGSALKTFDRRMFVSFAAVGRERQLCGRCAGVAGDRRTCPSPYSDAGDGRRRKGQTRVRWIEGTSDGVSSRRIILNSTTMGNAPSQDVGRPDVAPLVAPAEAPKKKICCACPETKKLRDECVVEHGEDACTKWIEAHKRCLRQEGFNV